MYMLKVYYAKRLMAVRVYESYESALSDMVEENSGLYDDISEELYPRHFTTPLIRAVSCDDTGFKRDFEYVFPKNIVVSIEEAIPEDRRKAR